MVFGSDAGLAAALPATVLAAEAAFSAVCTDASSTDVDANTENSAASHASAQISANSAPARQALECKTNLNNSMTVSLLERVTLKCKRPGSFRHPGLMELWVGSAPASTPQFDIHPFE